MTHGRCQAPSDFIEANPWMLKGTIMAIGSISTTGVSFQAGANPPSEPKGTSSNEHLLNAAGTMLFSNLAATGGKPPSQLESSAKLGGKPPPTKSLPDIDSGPKSLPDPDSGPKSLPDPDSGPEHGTPAGGKSLSHAEAVQIISDAKAAAAKIADEKTKAEGMGTGSKPMRKSFPEEK